MISWESANTTAQAGEKLQTVSGEPCFIFTQNVAADSKAKNKLESARKTSFGVKAGFCVEFTENATSKIDAPVGESVKGRVELEREVTLSR